MKADEIDELKLNPIDFLQALLERPRLAQYRKRWWFQAGLFNELDGIEYVLQNLVERLSALALREAEANKNKYSATWAQLLLCYWHYSSTHEEFKSSTTGTFLEYNEKDSWHSSEIHSTVAGFPKVELCWVLAKNRLLRHPVQRKFLPSHARHLNPIS